MPRHHSCLMACLPSNCLVSQIPKRVGRDMRGIIDVSALRCPELSQPVCHAYSSKITALRIDSAQLEKSLKRHPHPVSPQGLAANLHKPKEQIVSDPLSRL